MFSDAVPCFPMMHQEPFKTMAEGRVVRVASRPGAGLEGTARTRDGTGIGAGAGAGAGSGAGSGRADEATGARLPAPGEHSTGVGEPDISVPETDPDRATGAGSTGQPPRPCTTTRPDASDVSPERLDPRRISMSSRDDKENKEPSETTHCDDVLQADVSGQAGGQAPAQTPGDLHRVQDTDARVVKTAQEGRVDVVFPGTVTQDGCCRFVSEILKCILYQRQQLPMTYDQLVYSQKKQQTSIQDKEVVGWRPIRSGDMDWRKCQRTLQELEEVLQHLEVLFSLSLVPRVLLVLGGSLVLPKELYEINMEDLVCAAGDQSLRVSSCLRQLFRTLFVADILSDARPVHLMATTVLVLAHRDCGVGWFRPKLDFKVPTRIKRQIISLSTDAGVSPSSQADASAWQGYVWFQAPMAIKGFGK